MFQFPIFKLISSPAVLDTFQNAYTRYSGFKVPSSYYKNNRVFGIFLKDKMIGGFVLGTGNDLRTLEVFVGEESRCELYKAVAGKDISEICCFWIAPMYCKRFWTNLWIWVNMANIIRVWGTKDIIFGTNAVRLAALYGSTPKCKILHKDYLKRKQTFVFTANRSEYLTGFGQIIWYKMKRAVSTMLQRKRVRINLALSF